MEGDAGAAIFVVQLWWLSDIGSMQPRPPERDLAEVEGLPVGGVGADGEGEFAIALDVEFAEVLGFEYFIVPRRSEVGGELFPILSTGRLDLYGGLGIFESRDFG